MPPPPVRNPMHVHVDANALRAAPGGARAQERHLRPHARQGAQARGRGGDVAAVVRGEEVRGGEDMRRFDVVEADGADERRERLWRSGEDGGEGEAAGEGALQGVHRGGGDGVAGLRGEHEGEEGLEALVLGGGGWGVSEDGEWGWRGGEGGGPYLRRHGRVGQPLAAHRIDRRAAVLAHLAHRVVDFLPVRGGVDFHVAVGGADRFRGPRGPRSLHPLPAARVLAAPIALGIFLPRLVFDPSFRRRNTRAATRARGGCGGRSCAAFPLARQFPRRRREGMVFDVRWGREARGGGRGEGSRTEGSHGGGEGAGFGDGARVATAFGSSGGCELGGEGGVAGDARGAHFGGVGWWWRCWGGASHLRTSEYSILPSWVC